MKSAERRLPTFQEAKGDGGRMRIHSVAALTGLAEPTLRAWERRYGVPTPERTAAGYRLYSEADVEQILKMRRLCDSGISPAEAARSLREDVPKRRTAKTTRSETAATPPETVYAASIERILRAVAAFDDAALDDEIRRLYYLDVPTTILEQVVQPLMARVGSLWDEGDLSIVQEHLVSQKISLFLRDLVRLNRGSPSCGAVVLACFPEEEHEIGLLAFALHASSWGFRPIFFGAKTPPAALRGAVKATDAKLVGLSTTTPIEKARSRELMDEYATAFGKIPWIVGGAGAESAPDIVRSRGGWVAPASTVELEALVLHNLRAAASTRTSRA